MEKAVRRTIPAILMLWMSVTVTYGQTGDSKPAVLNDPDVQKLDLATSRLTAFLDESPAFRVETTTRWTLKGTPPRAGVTRCQLDGWRSQQFRLEISSGGDQNASLVCASDGQTLTRLYVAGPQAVVSRQKGNRKAVLDDAITDSSLKGTGLNVVLRPDAHAYLMSSVSNVKDCGRGEVRGQPADHFSADWFGGSKIEFWIAAGDAPVLLRWTRVMTIDVGGGSQELHMDSDLVWDIAAKIPANRSVVRIPPGAMEVKDIQTHLLKGGTDALLGKAAPAVDLELLDGTKWDVARHQGQQVVALFFFASWAAPSTVDIPKVLAFIEEQKDRPVATYAVNAGESSDEVRAFAESAKYSHPIVLDPQRRAVSAYRVTSLPVTVLIGKDGTVQAAHVGLSPETRALIRRDLEQLVDGKPLVALREAEDRALREAYCPKQEVQGEFELVGSVAMQQLAALWADGFRQVHSQVQLKIDCRGSESVLPALAKNRNVVGLLSRSLTEDERQQLAREAGARVVELTVCHDPLGLIVHAQNPVTGLRWSPDGGLILAPVEKPGPISWARLGVEGTLGELPIQLHGPPAQSGTHSYVEKLLASTHDNRPQTVEHASRDELMKAVAADRSGLALVSVSRGKGDGVRWVPLGRPEGPLVLPTDDEIAARTYPLMRPLTMLVRVSGERLEEPLLAEFVAYVFSRCGQQDAVKDGFVPLNASELHLQEEQLGWNRLQ